MKGEDIHPHAFPFVHTAAIEVTSKCNLQCTYCAVSQPGYKGVDMPERMIAELVAELRGRRLEQLCINGHGETTARKGWHDIFQPLVNEFRISIITNLARRLNADEIAFLSQIDSVNVSLDTVDASLLRQIRRSIKLEVVIKNLLDIRSAATLRGRAEPRFILYAGLYDKNVVHLEALARFAVTTGFSRVVFWNLVKYPDVPDAVNVNSLSTLGPEEKLKATRVIESSIDILEAHDVMCEFVGDYFEVLKRQVRAEPGRTVEKGLTKHCFDPWNYSQIKATGEVYPCCAHRPLGRIDETQKYSDILDGANLKTLRRGLLTGDLDEDCRVCSIRPTIAIAAFQAQYLSTFRVSRHDVAAIDVPPWHAAAPRGLDAWSRGLRSIVRKVMTAAWTGRVVGQLDPPAREWVRTRQLVVSGWCFSPKRLPVTGRILADGIYCGDVTQNRPRPDVVRAFGGRAPLMCGFVEKVWLPDAIKPGRPFTLRIQLNAGGTAKKWLSSGKLTLM